MRFSGFQIKSFNFLFGRRETTTRTIRQKDLERAIFSCLLVIKTYSFSEKKKAWKRLPRQKRNGAGTDEYIAAQFLRGQINVKNKTERERGHGLVYSEVERLLDIWSRRQGFLKLTKPKMRQQPLPALKTEAQIRSLVDGVLGQDWKEKFSKVESMLISWEGLKKPEKSYEVLVPEENDPFILDELQNIISLVDLLEPI